MSNSFLQFAFSGTCGRVLQGWDKSTNHEQPNLTENLLGKTMSQTRLKELPHIGKSPLERSKNVTECAFCGHSLKANPFVALSHRTFEPGIAICNQCIDKFSLLSRFSKNFYIYFQVKPDYEALKQKLLRKLFFEPGTPQEQEVITDICLRVLKRASAILGGSIDICPKTGLSLVDRIRVVLVGKNIKQYAKLFQVLCDELGLCFAISNKRMVESGEAFSIMTANLTGETGWSQNGIIFCQDGYVEPLSLSTVIFACEDEKEVPNGVEKISI
jgi:hypothetical protein